MLSLSRLSGSRSQALPGNALPGRLRLPIGIMPAVKSLDTRGRASRAVRSQAEPGNEGELFGKDIPMISSITRRAALKRVAAAGLAAPFVFRAHAAVPSETVYHASFGANGQALNDIGALTASKNLKLVAVADVDLSRTTEVRKRFPNVNVYQDWRELLDKEKNLNSVNVTVPNHMHASITMRAL